MARELIVVKVGGSLFDLPELGERLAGLVRALAPRRAILVPGGGPTADVIRSFDRWQGLGEERSHWLALRALTLNAHVLADLVPGAVVIEDRGQAQRVHRRRGVPILDAYRFVRHEEETGHPDRLPHHWNVTSDSVAARAAVVFGAPELILLKSVEIPRNADWDEAARRGWVDPTSPDVLRRSRPPLQAWAVNLRENTARTAT